MSISYYIAIIAEGKRERVVIDILFGNACLIFNREDLLEEKVLATRNARKFEDKHLTFKLTKPLHIYRIVDSNNDRFLLAIRLLSVIIIAKTNSNYSLSSSFI